MRLSKLISAMRNASCSRSMRFLKEMNRAYIAIDAILKKIEMTISNLMYCMSWVVSKLQMQ